MKHVATDRVGNMNKSNVSYWGLVRELALTDFKLKYQGSVIGYLWSLVKPLALFGILYVVFSVFVRFGSGVKNYPLQLLLGIVLWNFFAESTSNAMHAIVDKGGLIRKVYFPRIVILLATSVSALITLILNMIVVFIFMFFAHVYPDWRSLLFLPLLVELYLFTLGLSFILGALFVRYRDFSHIWELALQLLFYATPIIYPFVLLKTYMKFAALSPITQIIQGSRNVLIDPNAITANSLLHLPFILIPYLLPVVLAVGGYAYFERAAARFAEEV